MSWAACIGLIPLVSTLISGFLEAIRSFGLELNSSADETQTIKLEYKKSKVLMLRLSFSLIIL